MSVSATEPKNFRRDTADCCGFAIRLRRPVRLAALDLVMHEVTGDHRALAFREDVHAAMAGRMPRRRRQRDGVVERVIVIHQQRLPGLHDRQAIIAEDGAGRIAALGVAPPPRRRIRLCEKHISRSGMSAPSGHRAKSCSSRYGRCADACRTRGRSARRPTPSANSSLRQRSLPGKIETAADGPCPRRCRYRTRIV